MPVGNPVPTPAPSQSPYCIADKPVCSGLANQQRVEYSYYLTCPIGEEALCGWSQALYFSCKYYDIHHVWIGATAPTITLATDGSNNRPFNSSDFISTQNASIMDDYWDRVRNNAPTNWYSVDCYYWQEVWITKTGTTICNSISPICVVPGFYVYTQIPPGN